MFCHFILKLRFLLHRRYRVCLLYVHCWREMTEGKVKTITKNDPPPTNTSSACSTWKRQRPLQPPGNLFQQHEDNSTPLWVIATREFICICCSSPTPPEPLSIPNSAYCTLNKPPGTSKTNNIPFLWRSNKLVSEYLTVTPTLLTWSQHYVTASNSRQNS